MRALALVLLLTLATWPQPSKPEKVEPPRMPAVTGLKLEQALLRLQEARLAAPTVAYTAGSEGTVVRQIPPAGAELDPLARAPTLFIGRREVAPEPVAMAAPKAPPPPQGTNWLLLAITGLALTLGVSSLASRWGLAGAEGQVRITRREMRQKPRSPGSRPRT
ncbi:MAG: hypothetical protein AMXMBFR33_06160 [Candidatus Xenobia bacterium]